jgi:hypothetical protein
MEDVFQQTLQTGALAQDKPTSSGIYVSLDDAKVMLQRVCSDTSGLLLQGSELAGSRDTQILSYRSRR